MPPPSEDDNNISRSPSVSLIFDENDSSSDDNSGAGPRRRCSFVSNSSGVMDLRYPASVNGDKSYALSVCSDDDNNSLNTLKTEDALEKMGMFEVAISAGHQKKDDDGAMTRSNSSPEGGWLQLHKVPMKRHTLDHGGTVRRSQVVLDGTGDDDDSSVAKKKSKTFRKKVKILRCGQAAAIVLLLSTVIVSIILFETFDRPLFPAVISRTIANLFRPASGQEAEEIEQQNNELGRVMVQQLQTTMQEEPPTLPVNNHEYDKLFVQAFRNNQKITHRLNEDPMRQRKMKEENNHHEDKQRLVRVQAFRDNQMLAQDTHE